MKPAGREKEKSLESAALVKFKYHMLTGSYDEGFRKIYAGVLHDLGLDEKEVDKYIERNRAKLQKICDDK